MSHHCLSFVIFQCIPLTKPPEISSQRQAVNLLIQSFVKDGHFVLMTSRCSTYGFNSPKDQLAGTLQWFRVNEPVFSRGVLVLKMTPVLRGQDT